MKNIPPRVKRKIAMKGKRILYVASGMGHIRDFHLPYIEALRQDGCEVKVMASGRGADFDIPFEKKIFSRKNRECRKSIKEILRKENFDAIILNTTLAAYHVRRALPRNCRAKIVNIMHGYLFSADVNPVKRLLLYLAERSVRRRTDAVITMNRRDFLFAKKKKLGKEVYFTKGMGATLRPIITPSEEIRAEYFGKDSFVMCFVGEYSGRKNQRFLIEALREIKPHIPEAMLCLVGDGDARAELEEMISKRGLSGSVLLTGRRSDACDFIRASDLYVSASVIEGMPFNVIEALGAGKTVLVSKIKGHEDLVDDGESGYLYKYGDLAEFVNKTCQIYKNNPINPEKIRQKYLEYERETVFFETLSVMKKAILGGADCE